MGKIPKKRKQMNKPSIIQKERNSYFQMNKRQPSVRGSCIARSREGFYTCSLTSPLKRGCYLKTHIIHYFKITYKNKLSRDHNFKDKVNPMLQVLRHLFINML